MANKVLMIIGNRRIIMSVEDMTKDYIDNEMICNGRIWGSETNLCSAPMSAKFSRSDGHCIGFTESLRTTYPHACGCENSRKSTYRSVTGLDYSGGRHNKKDYLDRLFSENGVKRKKITSPHEIDDTELDYVPKTPNENDPKDLKRKTQHPRTLKQLVMLLQYLRVSHRYMDKSVYDWIVDFRSLRTYQQFGIPNDERIIICKLSNNNNLGFAVDENDWILSDCTYDGNPDNAGNHCFFKLDCSNIALKKLKAFSVRKDRHDFLIAVCSVWKKDSECNNLWLSETLTENRIVYIERKYFKT